MRLKVLLLGVIGGSVFGQGLSPSAPAAEYFFFGGRQISSRHAPADYFTGDVPMSDPRHYVVNVLKDRSITQGCVLPPNPEFCINWTITRGQMAVFIVRLIYAATKGDPEAFTTGGGPAPFNDVAEPGHPFWRYIRKLSELGITSGCSTNPPLFCPDSPVENRQMAVFVVGGEKRIHFRQGKAEPVTPVGQPLARTR